MSCENGVMNDSFYASMSNSGIGLKQRMQSFLRKLTSYGLDEALNEDEIEILPAESNH
jgi:hypothetical protein